MEIRVDTDLMQIISRKALLAKDAMTEAVKAAEAVTVHDDWNCAERDLINESITMIKKNNRIVSENMAMYSDQVKTLAMQFDEMDRSILARFSGVDSSVGELFQIENATVTNNANTQTISSGDLQRVSTSLGENTYWNQYHVNNMTKPISVLKFSDASCILSGADNNKSQDDLMKELVSDLGFDELIGG